MGTVIPFKRKSPKERARGNTMCDVQAGKLVTVSRCVRCATERLELT
ncbi:MAG: hypothetical protein ACI9W2_002704 [Gammaproteobacteria bacterium]|jgi:hypothetical protein